MGGGGDSLVGPELPAPRTSRGWQRECVSFGLGGPRVARPAAAGLAGCAGPPARPALQRDAARAASARWDRRRDVTVIWRAAFVATGRVESLRTPSPSQRGLPGPALSDCAAGGAVRPAARSEGHAESLRTRATARGGAAAPDGLNAPTRGPAAQALMSAPVTQRPERCAIEPRALYEPGEQGEGRRGHANVSRPRSHREGLRRGRGFRPARALRLQAGPQLHAGGPLRRRGNAIKRCRHVRPAIALRALPSGRPRRPSRVQWTGGGAGPAARGHHGAILSGATSRRWLGSRNGGWPPVSPLILTTRKRRSWVAPAFRARVSTEHVEAGAAGPLSPLPEICCSRDLDQLAERRQTREMKMVVPTPDSPSNQVAENS